LADEKKNESVENPVQQQQEALNKPVLTYGQMLEGQSLLRKFLKKIEIRVKGEKVVTSYIWEFPDEIVAKTFAEQMKEQFSQSLNQSQ